MPVEDRKDTIAFIICVNNELYFEECRYYIEHLEVSAGYDIDVIGIWEADSMCAAYNLGMRSSDAKYKVYSLYASGCFYPRQPFPGEDAAYF